MGRNVLAITALAGICAAGFFYLQATNLSSDLTRVSAELAATAERLEQAREAQAALSDHFERVRQNAERWRQEAESLANMEGADEPLNAYERGVLDRLLAPASK